MTIKKELIEVALPLDAITPYYGRPAFRRETDFGVTSVSCDIVKLLTRSEPPA